MNAQAATQDDSLDRLFAGANAFSRCSKRDRQALRTRLERRREALKIVDLTGARASVLGILPAGNLYCVLQGRVSVFWQTEADKRLSILMCSAGEVFGELQSSFFTRPAASLGLLAEPVPSRRQRSASLLELPAELVAELLANTALEKELAATAIERLRHIATVTSLGSLKRSDLMVAYLCLSQFCGHSGHDDPSVQYLGRPVTSDKIVTFRELSQMSGLAMNTVRSCVRNLERMGYIVVHSRDRGRGTHISIQNPARLVQAIELRALTAFR